MPILADAFKECIEKNDYICSISDSCSIDRSPSPSLDMNRECVKSIKGFSGSKPRENI